MCRHVTVATRVSLNKPLKRTAPSPMSTDDRYSMVFVPLITLLAALVLMTLVGFGKN